jgi:hypothetical protein
MQTCVAIHKQRSRQRKTPGCFQKNYITTYSVQKTFINFKIARDSEHFHKLWNCIMILNIFKISEITSYYQAKTYIFTWNIFPNQYFKILLQKTQH